MAYVKDVCSTKLLNDGPVMLGGPGVIVQIDESLFLSISQSYY